MNPEQDSNRWVKIILAFSVVIAICEPMIIRITTGQPISDNLANVLNTYTQTVGIGLLLLNKKEGK